MPWNALAASAPTTSNPLGGMPAGTNSQGSGGWPSWMTTAWGMPASQQTAQPTPQAAPQQAFASPNAPAQSTLDSYAQALTGTGFGSLGNGPIDPGAFMLLQQINPQMAASMIGTPQSPFGRQTSAGGGPGGDAQGAGGMGY
jgi:hypothetical protein